MTKKYLMSQDIEVDALGAIATRTNVASLAGDMKTIGAAPTTLVAVSTPCQFVWLGAPCDADGVAQNTKPAFIGETALQTTAAKGAIPLMPSNFEGLVIQIDDAIKLFIGGLNTEEVAYRIFV